MYLGGIGETSQYIYAVYWLARISLVSAPQTSLLSFIIVSFNSILQELRHFSGHVCSYAPSVFSACSGLSRSHLTDSVACCITNEG